MCWRCEFRRAIGVLQLAVGEDLSKGLLAQARKRVVLAVTHTAAGGVVELWQDLAKELRLKGHQVDLLALYPKDDANKGAPLLSDWRYIWTKRLWAPFRIPLLGLGLLKYLHRHKPDVIITAMPLSSVMIPIAAALHARAKVIVTHHSPAFTYAATLRWLDRITGALGSVSAIVGVSCSVTETFMNGPSRYNHKLSTIKNALPRSIEREILRVRLEQSPNNNFRAIASIGRLSAQKNYVTLVKALLHIERAHLHIVGDGEDRDMLSQLVADLGLHERVTFHGHLARSDALGIASSCSIFAQPSLFEGRSLALLEAAALGLPLVVSDAPTQVEAVTTSSGAICGKVVPAHSPTGLAAAICAIWGDKSEYEHWRLASEAISKDCSMDEMVSGYIRLIEEAA